MNNETTAATPVPSAEAQEGGQPYLEMVERGVQAILAVKGYRGHDEYYRMVFRAVIDELRKPTEAMWAAERIALKLGVSPYLAALGAAVSPATVAADNTAAPKTDETKGGTP